MPLPAPHRHPDVSVEQRAADELIKRIRQLRWMGLEQEARRMLRSSLRVCTAAVEDAERFAELAP